MHFVGGNKGEDMILSLWKRFQAWRLDRQWKHLSGYTGDEEIEPSFHPFRSQKEKDQAVRMWGNSPRSKTTYTSKYLLFHWYRNELGGINGKGKG